MSQNSIEPWKLTAFLLNELDSDDRQLIEAAVTADAALKQELDSLRSTLDRTRSVLATPIAGAELAPANRALIASEIQSSQACTTNVSLAKADKPASPQWKWAALAALAASFLIGILAWPAFYGPTHLAHVNEVDLGDMSVATPSETPPSSTSALSKDAAASTNVPELSVVEESKTRVAPSEPVKNELSNAGRVLDESLARNSAAKESDLKALNANDGLASDSSQASPVPQLAQRLNPSNEKESLAKSPSADTRVMSATTSPASDPLAQSSVDAKFRQDSFDATTPLSREMQIAPAYPTEGQTGRFMLGGSVDSESGKMESSLARRDTEAESPDSSRVVMDAAPGSRDLSAAYIPTPSVQPQDAPTRFNVDKRLQEADGEKSARVLGSSAFDPVMLSGAGKELGLGDVESERFALGQDVRAIPGRRLAEPPSRDRFEKLVEAPFVLAKSAPLSTFSIDVDTASYSKIRQYIVQANALPQPSTVRIEEMINYFDYAYAGPTDEHPFSSNMAVATCPWNTNHQLIRIGLQAKKVEVKERPKANIVFLLDVSGSMDQPNKLPLVKQAIAMLTKQLGENDRIAMVVYAGAAGCVLPSITGDHQTEILAALDNLSAGGSTNGGQGIELAYSIARDHFIAGGINRIILCTDGDFNVGTTSNEGLIKLVETNAKSKIFLTCFGFGMGNYNDSMMEQITNRGNGVYGMIDNIHEARRLMVEQLSGTLITVAKDVKVQVEFNPAKVASYRLIGYENRRLTNADFNNDAKDAGEIGAGHRVTALYEIVPVGTMNDTVVPPVDELRYGSKPKEEKDLVPSSSAINAADEKSTAASDEWMTLKLRYKQPEGDVSTKVEFFLKDADVEAKRSDRDFEWASAVAEFGLLLRHSQYAPQADWDKVIRRAQDATGDNPYRLECIEMMIKAKALQR
jgi:secreted protein with Ig-like and vWFA domain